MLQDDKNNKAKMKTYYDRKAYVKEHHLKIGDLVLVRQNVGCSIE